MNCLKASSVEIGPADPLPLQPWLNDGVLIKQLGLSLPLRIGGVKAILLNPFLLLFLLSLWREPSSEKVQFNLRLLACESFEFIGLSNGTLGSTEPVEGLG